MRHAIRCLLASVLFVPTLTFAQTAPKRPSITGVAFISFAVSDVAAADKFYGGTLGLTRVTSSGGEPTAPLTIYAVNRNQWISVKHADATPAPANSRIRMVGFTTTDLPQLTKYLEAHGYPSAMPVSKGELAVRDPEGNLVVFVQKGAVEGVADSAASPSAIAHRIIHVGFVVHDPVKENRFWRETLGFKPYWHGGHDDVSTDYVSQQVPDGTDWLEYMLNTSPDADARQRGGSNHVSLGVDSMDTVIAQLKQNGCMGPTCTDAKLGRDGKVQLNLFDPDLSRIEVMEFRPSGKTCCSEYTGAHPSDSK